MKKSLRVTNSDISMFLGKWILEGQEFHTPVRECGMVTATWGYVGGITASTVSSRLEDCHDGYFNYDVFSYKTIIMRVQMIKDSDGTFHLVSAYLDDRKYSPTTAKTQGYCEWALMRLFGLGSIPCVVGKRGGKYARHNYMAVIGSKENWYSWGVLDTDTGEIHALNQDGDPYNGDTEGYY